MTMYSLCIMQAMMLNDRIQNIRTLQEALARAEEFLSKLPLATPYSEFEFEYDLSPFSACPFF